MRMTSSLALRRAQLLFAALACAASVPVFAGAEFSAVTKNTNSGTRLPAFGNATVDGRVDNERMPDEHVFEPMGLTSYRAP